MKTFLTCCFFSILAISFLFTSCSPQLSFSIQKDKPSAITFKTETDSSVESAVRSLLNLPQGSGLFDISQVFENLSSAGIIIESLSFPSVTGIQFSGYLLSLKDALPKVPGAITFSEETSSLNIKISPEILQQTINLMPSETAEYIELLMAPALTGEEMTNQEYSQLISTVYGNSSGQALEKSVLKIKIRAPSKIKTATISDKSLTQPSISEKDVIFSIPLISILTKQTSTDLSITW